jgi:hypothetical protein
MDNFSQYQCPKCGWWSESERKSPNLKKVIDLGAGPEYGEIRWEEHWVCPHCKIEFSFENGNY